MSPDEHAIKVIGPPSEERSRNALTGAAAITLARSSASVPPPLPNQFRPTVTGLPTSALSHLNVIILLKSPQPCPRNIGLKIGVSADTPPSPPPLPVARRIAAAATGCPLACRPLFKSREVDHVHRHQADPCPDHLCTRPRCTA